MEASGSISESGRDCRIGCPYLQDAVAKASIPLARELPSVRSFAVGEAVVRWAASIRQESFRDLLELGGEVAFLHPIEHFHHIALHVRPLVSFLLRELLDACLLG